MKINAAEALSGVSKKNIRFYEEQGLLRPQRNAENGYRVYGEEEVQILLRIRLMRKLGVSIEEIRKMLDGTHTVGDGMRRHLISLEREKRNLEQSMQLCEQLQNVERPIGMVDAQEMLEHMAQLEQGGVRFPEQQEVRTRYAAPVVVAAAVSIVMLGLCALVIWAFFAAPKEAPLMGILALLLLFFCTIVFGVVLAMQQQIREFQ